MTTARGSGVAAAWDAAPKPLRTALDGAYASLVAGGLACGAAIADKDDRVIAAGRNRAYDPPGGADPLQGNPIAHAEMNALAGVPTALDLAGVTLWTSQEPCAMCTTAARFTGVGTVRYLAPDPWAIATGISRSGDDRPRDDPGETVVVALDDPGWLAAANVLFLLSIARVRDVDHPTIQANRELEPEITALAVDLASDTGSPLPGTLDGFLSLHGAAIDAAARQRADRRASSQVARTGGTA